MRRFHQGRWGWLIGVLQLFGCSAEQNLLPNWPECESYGLELSPDEATPFGPSGREIVETLSAAEATAIWDYRDGAPDPEPSSEVPDLNSLKMTLRLNPYTGVGRRTSVGYLHGDTLASRMCMYHPFDGLRLNLLVHISDPAGTFSASGTAVVFLQGPNLDRRTVDFREDSLGPLTGWTADRDLAIRAAADGAAFSEDPTSSDFEVSIFGRQETGHDWLTSGVFLYLYANDERRRANERFARARLNIAWLSDPLWDEGITP